MTATTFAKPPQNPLSSILQVTTVVAALLLGAAFAASMFTDTAEDRLRAAVASAPAKAARS